jgi:hypothetical protein
MTVDFAPSWYDVDEGPDFRMPLLDLLFGGKPKNQFNNTTWKVSGDFLIPKE